MRFLMSTRPSVSRTSRRLLVLGTLVATIVGGLAYTFTVNPPGLSAAERLSAHLHPRMPISAVQQQAELLGFAWQVHPTSPEPGSSGSPGRESTIHIICHQRPINGTVESGRHGAIEVCEELRLAPSFGALFASHSCNIVFRGGEIERFWLYAD